jgi:hypothetical protein
VRTAIPLGAEERDFESIRDDPRPTQFFDSRDGCLHLCYVGTLLPLGIAPVTALLMAFAKLRQRRPDLYLRTRLHFVGTSNQTSGGVKRVDPIAQALGVADIVQEHPSRVDYAEAVRLQAHASAILLLGSTERHYTPSKVFPALLARRPILAAFHERSDVVDLLRRAVRAPSVRVVTYGDDLSPETFVDDLYPELVALLERPVYQMSDTTVERFEEFSAKTMAGRLATLFDAVHLKKCRAA